MKKEDRLKIYRKYDGHCAYCGKSIEYKDMQVDHLVPKNRGCYSRWSDKEGKFVVFHGDDSMENYMPSCSFFPSKDVACLWFNRRAL